MSAAVAVLWWRRQNIPLGYLWTLADDWCDPKVSERVVREVLWTIPRYRWPVRKARKRSSKR